jgi:hypothetical protein
MDARDTTAGNFVTEFNTLLAAKIGDNAATRTTPPDPKRFLGKLTLQSLGGRTQVILATQTGELLYIANYHNKKWSEWFPTSDLVLLYESRMPMKWPLPLLLNFNMPGLRLYRDRPGDRYQGMNPVYWQENNSESGSVPAFTKSEAKTSEFLFGLRDAPNTHVIWSGIQHRLNLPIAETVQAQFGSFRTEKTGPLNELRREDFSYVNTGSIRLKLQESVRPDSTSFVDVSKSVSTGTAVQMQIGKQMYTIRFNPVDGTLEEQFQRQIQNWNRKDELDRMQALDNKNKSLGIVMAIGATALLGVGTIVVARKAVRAR